MSLGERWQKLLRRLTAGKKRQAAAGRTVSPSPKGEAAFPVGTAGESPAGGQGSFPAGTAEGSGSDRSNERMPKGSAGESPRAGSGGAMPSGSAEGVSSGAGGAMPSGSAEGGSQAAFRGAAPGGSAGERTSARLDGAVPKGSAEGVSLSVPRGAMPGGSSSQGEGLRRAVPSEERGAVFSQGESVVLAGPPRDPARELSEVLRLQRRMRPSAGAFGEEVL